MSYNMNPLIMECPVPFPSTGIKCPACNRFQRDSSSFKTHARRVHKTLNIHTPSTFSVCQHEFPTFRAGSIHYARVHGEKSRRSPPPSASQVPTGILPSTPEMHAILSSVINRSPPTTCLTVRRSPKQSQTPSTQDLIAEFLNNSPTRPFTPMSPVQPTSSCSTDCPRPSTQDIAPPIPLHSRSTICPHPERQVNQLIEHLRRVNSNR